MIGALGDSDAAMHFFRGMIDDVKIYNYARTAEQIAADANLDADRLVAHWALDESSGTTATDSSGNGHDGTLTPSTGSGPQWTAGIRDGALSFDGMDDFVQAATDGLPVGGEPRTLAAFVRLDPNGANDQYIVGWGDSPGSTGSKWYLNAYNGRLRLVCWYSDITSTATIPYDRWLHVAAVYDGTTATLYLDGVPAAVPAIMTLSTVAESFMIGALGDSDAAMHFFRGMIDDVKIYNYARTAEQIAAEADSDDDGLPDGWEQQIIDANTSDAITTLADVLPGDDYDGDGTTNAQEYATGTDPTDAEPGDFSPSGVVETSRPTFTWPATSGATWYEIFIRKEGSWQWSTWVQKDTSWSPDWSFDSGSYEWWVRGWSMNQGEGEWSAGTSFEVLEGQEPVPTAPSGIVGEGRPQFTWDGVGWASWYEIFIRKEGSWDWPGNWVQTSTSWLPTYQDQPYSLPSGNYEWWIRGWSIDTGYGEWSSGMSFTIHLDQDSVPAPQAPSGTTADPRPTFMWTGVDWASWYELFIRKEGAWDWPGVWVQGSTSWVPIHENQPYSLPSGNYEWWVRGWSADRGYGGWSTGLSFKLE